MPNLVLVGRVFLSAKAGCGPQPTRNSRTPPAATESVLRKFLERNSRKTEPRRGRTAVFLSLLVARASSFALQGRKFPGAEGRVVTLLEPFARDEAAWGRDELAIILLTE